jgi:hypothetical protein
MPRRWPTRKVGLGDLNTRDGWSGLSGPQNESLHTYKDNTCTWKKLRWALSHASIILARRRGSRWWESETPMAKTAQIPSPSSQLRFRLNLKLALEAGGVWIAEVANRRSHCVARRPTSNSWPFQSIGAIWGTSKTMQSHWRMRRALEHELSRVDRGGR